MTYQANIEYPTGAPMGLSYIPEFFTPSEQATLVDELSKLDWETRGLIRRMGRVVKRREIDFIRRYQRNKRELGAIEPLPGFLAPIRDRCAEAMEVGPEQIGQVIAALYRPEAAIAKHVDSTNAFGNLICGLSLVSACSMVFRLVDGEQTWKMTLEPRSLLIMSGPSRYLWSHEIPPVKQLRYSLTMRTLLSDS